MFPQGRQNEHRVDASALRADEGRGIAAISEGEPRAGCDPSISEWGNPMTFLVITASKMRRAPGELKHLSTPRNRNYSRSSGERTGRCLNHFSVKLTGVADVGLEDQSGETVISQHFPVDSPKTSGMRRQSG